MNYCLAIVTFHVFVQSLSASSTWVRLIQVELVLWKRVDKLRCELNDRIAVNQRNYGFVHVGTITALEMIEVMSN